MPITMKETSFTYEVPIPDGIKAGKKKEFMEKVGRYLVDSMLDMIADGNSPVEGIGEFKELNPEYAEEEKGGNRTANMDEHGDMLQALTYKIVGNTLKIGIFDERQAIKSYAHNTGFKGHPYLEGKAPKRQFIPGKDETLDEDILRGVGGITDEYLG